MQLTWFGHSTVRVELGETTLLIDPFFENPKTTADPSDLNPDHVLVTHGHADHIADVGAYADTHLVATPEIAAYLGDEYGVEDTTGMNLGGTVELGDAHVTMHRADHSNGIETGYEASGGMPAGYVVSTAKPARESDPAAETFYHAGDTALMTEMREVIEPFLEPDIAAIPIGDHFTMGPGQAAIAVNWLDVEYAVPIHYDTFPPIEQDPDDFRRAVRSTGSDAEVLTPPAGERFDPTAER